MTEVAGTDVTLFATIQLYSLVKRLCLVSPALLQTSQGLKYLFLPTWALYKALSLPST